MSEAPGADGPVSIVWVSRSFSDYRLPVFRELDRLVEGRLQLLYSREYVGEALSRDVAEALGQRAIGLTGEWRLGVEDRDFMANRNLSLRLQPGLGKRIARLRPDVVLGEGFFKWSFQALRYCKRTRTPLVVNYERTAHTERHVQWYRRLYRRWALGHTAVVNCSGRLCREYVASLGFPPERIRTGHMVADTEGLAARAVVGSTGAERGDGASRRPLVFLFVGRLIERKGVRQLLEAWEVFQDDAGEPAHLVLAGTGGLEALLRRRVEERGVTGVRFTGAVPYAEVAALYGAADVLVMPTLEDNWSLVVPEGMACGLPVVCSIYNGGWPELVRDGENGWLVDPNDVTGFAAMLARAAGAGDRLPAMGRRSQEIIEGGHTPDHAARSILDACRAALASHAPAAVSGP